MGRYDKYKSKPKTTPLLKKAQRIATIIMVVASLAVVIVQLVIYFRK